MSIDNNEKISKLSFEQAMQELQEIVSKLEKGGESLENAINSYQYGNKLKQHCEKMLKDAKTKIEKITSVNEGEVLVEPLD